MFHHVATRETAHCAWDVRHKHTCLTSKYHLSLRISIADVTLESVGRLVKIGL